MIIKEKKNTENLPSSEHCLYNGTQIVNQRKRKYRQVIELCLRTKKDMEDEDDTGTKCNWQAWNTVPKVLEMWREVL